MKDHDSFYLLHKPAAYAENRAWPVILDVGGRSRPADEALSKWKTGGAKDGYVIVAISWKTAGKERRAALARACLDDAKSKLRLDPERVLVSGQGDGADAAAALCATDPELFAGCVAFGLSVAPEITKKAPPFHIVLWRGDARGRDAASALASAGVDVLARTGFAGKEADEPKALEWFAAKAASSGDLETADRFLESRRYLDATLVCLGLLDQPGQERPVRLRLRKVEAAGIVALGSVEVAMAERKYLDAWLRCRDAAAQFAWLPVGEKIRKRLSELEADARVRKARETED